MLPEVPRLLGNGKRLLGQPLQRLVRRLVIVGKLPTDATLFNEAVVGAKQERFSGETEQRQ